MMKKTLVVEGTDDKSFCEQFFKTLEISQSNKDELPYRVMGFKPPDKKTWVRELKPIIESLKSSDEKYILGVVVDSDQNTSKTLKDFQEAWSELNPTFNSKIKPNVFCGQDQKVGLFICEPINLESVCLNIVKDEQIQQEIKQFIQQIKSKFPKDKIKHEAKKDLQIYLAFKELWEHKANFQIYLASKYDRKFAYSPGTAAQKNYWNFQQFDELKSFLENFI